MAKKIEPNMTPARRLGMKCPKCGCCTRYKKNGSCVRCHRAIQNKSRARQMKVPGHPRREKMRQWQKKRDAARWKDPIVRARQYELRRARYAINFNGTRDKYITAAIARETVVKQRTPSWANRAKIGRIYAKARAIGMTIDHVIPLQGKLVTGLHVEGNLRIMTKSKNSSKCNKWEVSRVS